MKGVLRYLFWVFFAFAIVCGAMGFAVGRATAQEPDGIRGHGHAEHHDAYKSLHNPQTGMICCNAQTADDPNGDCRPGAVWRDADGHIRARIGNATPIVPEDALIPDKMNPHPPNGMICERFGHFYCVAMSGAGT